MRIVDADILAYALYDEHIANEYAWPVIEMAIRGKYKLFVTHTTILKTYNVLFWQYRIRPRKKLLEKLKLTLQNLVVIPPSDRGIDIAIKENIPLGDGYIIATAIDRNIPVIITNDKHITKKAPKYGLTTQNPIPEHIRKLMK